MRSILHYLFVILIGGLLLAGCDNDKTDKLYSDRPDAGYISFILSGRQMGYNVNIDQTYKLYNNDLDSYLNKRNSVVHVKRYSDDFQSAISLYIPLDTINYTIEDSSSYVNYDILNLNADYTVMRVQGQSMDSLTFSNFKYDTAGKIMSGDFKFTVKSVEPDSIDLTMTGNFKVNLFINKYFLLW